MGMGVGVGVGRAVAERAAVYHERHRRASGGCGCGCCCCCCCMMAAGGSEGQMGREAVRGAARIGSEVDGGRRRRVGGGCIGEGGLSEEWLA